MKKIGLAVVVQLMAITAMAQWREDFGDGNFTSNPPWTGNVGDWMVNGNGQLQSNGSLVNSSFYLSTPSTMASVAEWEFFVRLNFNTSSTNYADVFVMSSSGDLSATATTGYFIRLGNTQDEVSLYRKDGAVIVKIIDGVDGVTAGADNILRIKLVRDAQNIFTLYRDDGGTGNNYVIEGSATDNTYLSSAWFGFLVKQSTASFFGKHFFDEINVYSYVPDITPPVLVKAIATSPTGLDVYFSEPVASSAIVPNNYTVDAAIGHPILVQKDATNATLVHAEFSPPFSSGTNYALTVENVSDLSGNAMNPSVINFIYYEPQAYDMIIDEIMADPSPPAGLPNAEYLELKNRSAYPIDLTGWRLGTGTSISDGFPSCRLLPDSFVVLTSVSAAGLWPPGINVLNLSHFPSLDNEGATVRLVSKEGRTIHAVAYSANWYDAPVKKQGGWSLEMIDTDNPCTWKDNWKASTDMRGGTPGRKNSVDGVLRDVASPQLIRAYAIDSLTIAALFDKPLDSTIATLTGHYQLNGISIIKAQPQPFLFNTVYLTLSAPLQKGQIYQLAVDGISDCRGNTVSNNKARVGIPEPAEKTDLVINEILFDPPPAVSDFVELYNRSHKIIDLGEFYLANRTATGQPNNPQKITDVPFPLFPGDYLLITENIAGLRRHYLVSGQAIESSVLPSLPDDEGTLILLNAQGQVIDELNYSAKWHFPLITNPQGVSLERIDPSTPTQDQHNWHSAASTAGYATPGYKNSQYKNLDGLQAQLTITPEIFSPDNDGRDDILTIAYTVDAIGYVANITIFDAEGRTIRQLVKNNLLGLNGKWTWDGLDASARQLPPGPYIIYTELFNLQGKRKSFKRVVFLAP